MSQQAWPLFLALQLFPFTVAPKLIPLLTLELLICGHHLPFREGHFFLHDPPACFPLPSTAGEQYNSAIVGLAQISNFPLPGKPLLYLPAVISPLSCS